MYYMSGIPQLKGQNVQVVVKVDRESVIVSIPLVDKVRILKEHLISVQEKTEDQISKDVTLTRLLAFGIFAFGMKKKRRNTEKYLILSYMEGHQQMAAVFRGHPQYMFKMLFDAVNEGQSIRDAKYPPAPLPPPSRIVTGDIVLDRLTQLNELWTAGAISEDEYNRLKADIIGPL